MHFIEKKGLLFMKQGSKIGIVCCSNGLRPEQAETIKMLVQILEKSGLEVDLSPYLYGDEIAVLQNYPPVGLPYCAGYACGYHLVKHYLKKTGKSIVEATLLPASEILEVVEDFCPIWIFRPLLTKKSIFGDIVI